MTTQLTTAEKTAHKRKLAADRQQRLRDRRTPFCVAFKTADSDTMLYLTAADKLATLAECKQAGVRARIKTFATTEQAQSHIDSLTALANAIQANKVYGIKQIVKGSAIKVIMDCIQAGTENTFIVQAKSEAEKGELK